MSNIEQALKSLIEALEYHTEQTRPIQKAIEAIALGKSALAEIEKGEPVGWYCKACKETGLSHCSDPVNCGGMVRTYTLPQQREWKDIDLSEYENQGLGVIAEEICTKLKQLNTEKG